MDGLTPIGADIELRGLDKWLRGMGRMSASTRSSRDAIGGMQKSTVSFSRIAEVAIGNIAAKAFATLGRSVVSAGKSIGRFVAGSIEDFGEFQLHIARVGTLLDDGVDAMDTFGGEVLRSSVRFATDVERAADAVFQGISAGAGATAKDVETFNEVVGKASVGGFTEMATAVDGLTTVMNVYGLKAKDAMSVSDAFFVANKLGKTTFEELSSSIGRVAPAARAVGISYEELLAATVSLTKGGTVTAEVMSSLKAVIANVATPTAEATKVAEDLGIEFSLAGLQSKGFAGFLADLTARTSGNVQAQKDLFGSIEAFNAVARLASAEGLKDFDDAMKGLAERSGATEKAFTKVSDTLGFKMKQIKSAAARFRIEMGGGLVEGLGLDKIANIPESVEEASTKLRSAARSFARSFKEAFAPGFDFADLPLDRIAERLGSAAGRMADAFGGMLDAMVNFVNSGAFKDLMGMLGGFSHIYGFVTGRAEGADAQAKNLGGFVVRDPGEMMREARRQAVAANPGRFFMGDDGQISALVGLGKKEIDAAVDAQFRKLDRAQRAHLKRQAEANEARAEARRSEAERAYTLDQSPGWVSREEPFVNGQSMESAGVIEVALKMDQKLEVKKDGKKGSTRRRSFSARGRGDGRIQAAWRDEYVLFEDELVPISDEFAYYPLATVRAE